MIICATRGRVYFPLSKKTWEAFQGWWAWKMDHAGQRESNKRCMCAFTVCAYLNTQVCVPVSVMCVLCCWPPAHCYCCFPFISPTFSLSLTGPQSGSVSLASTRISPPTAAKMLTWTDAYRFFFLLSVHESGKVGKKKRKSKEVYCWQRKRIQAGKNGSIYLERGKNKQTYKATPVVKEY